MKYKFLYLFLAISVSWTSCSKSQQDNQNGQSAESPLETAKLTSAIQPPVQKLVKAPLVFTIDANKSHELETPKGSKILIPANAFCDENGKAIKGEVNIEFEEFHDATDIILSGIPMHIETEDGSMETLESAGMFRIQGSAKGKEVRVAAGKELEIQLASYKTGDDFNFYELEETSGNWTEKGRTQPVANPVYETALSKIGKEPIKPVAIQKASSNDLVFSLDVNKNANPEFSYFDNVMWKLAEGEKTDKSLFKSQIRNPDLKCVDADRSIFTLSGNVEGKQINSRVTPVLFGSNWQKAKKSFASKMGEYNKVLKERNDKLNAIKNVSKVSRTFSLASFGTYNFDRIMKLKRRVEFKPLFWVPALKLMLKKAFLIEKKNKSLIPYTSASNGVFMFDPHERNVIIALDDQGNLYEFPEEKFADIQKRDLDAESEYQFTLNATGIQINEQAELRDYIDRL